jgi:hypothetical protein
MATWNQVLFPRIRNRTKFLGNKKQFNTIAMLNFENDSSSPTTNEQKKEGETDVAGPKNCGRILS